MFSVFYLPRTILGHLGWFLSFFSLSTVATDGEEEMAFIFEKLAKSYRQIFKSSGLKFLDIISFGFQQ